MDIFADRVVVGLTGSIASGKSTALSNFKRLGWQITSTDAIVSALWKENEYLKEKISEHWGKDEIFSRGSIDKRKIARLIFENPQERLWLENIIHPLVRSNWVTFIQNSDTRYHVVEVPLLFEKELDSYFQKTISVYVSQTVQLTRLVNRELTIEVAKSRVDSQFSSIDKMNRADFVLSGNGSKEFLSNQVERISAYLFKT